jgi:hypothetical protein
LLSSEAGGLTDGANAANRSCGNALAEPVPASQFQAIGSQGPLKAQKFDSFSQLDLRS